MEVAAGGNWGRMIAISRILCIRPIRRYNSKLPFYSYAGVITRVVVSCASRNRR